MYGDRVKNAGGIGGSGRYSSAMAHWLLLDGFNLAFRSYYAVPDLTRGDGFPTGAVMGWVRTIWKLQDAEKPDRMVAFFDLGGSSRHAALLPEYKQNRTSMPEPLVKQLPVIKDVTRALGVPVVEREGVEADDLVASTARRLCQEGHRVTIVSADKDFGQCVGATVSQLLPAPTANPKLGWRKLDEAGVMEKFGVPPEKIPHFLAIVGDTSDNIPGLEGVGPKTAAKWLAEFPTLDVLLTRWNWVKPERFRTLIKASEELLRRNLELVTLQRDLDPGPLPEIAPDVQRALELLEGLEMKAVAREAEKRLRGAL